MSTQSRPLAHAPLRTHVGKIDQSRYFNRTTAVFEAWLKQPSQVASICPSSPVLTRAIADRRCIREARRVVDLGPGTGGTTAAILRLASEDVRVLAIEKTSQFIGPLNAIGDRRLTVQEGDAIGLERLLLQHEMTSPDVIVSGIPFSSIPPKDARSIMASIHRTLRDGGVLIAYQLRNHVKRYAAEFFRDQPRVETVWLNVPPLRVYQWTKRRADDEPVREPPNDLSPTR